MKPLIRPRCLAAAVAALACAAAARAPAAMEMRVTLRKALFHGDAPSPRAAALLLELRREDQRWGRVWGVAKDYSVALHPGRVVKSSLAEDRVELSVEMCIQADAWASGGRAAYEITLERRKDGTLTGRYTGRFNGVELRGEAQGRIRPPRRAVAGITPAEAAEHPRILFRRADLPPLRDKLKTPFGQAALKKLTARKDNAVALALLHQLTGKGNGPRQAMPLVEKLMDRGLLSDQFGHNLGVRMERVAIAYDLCHDAWPEAFKRKVEAYLLWAAHDMLHDQGSMNRGINWHVSSNWSAPLYTGLGFAGLALWGEKGPRPPKPIETNTGARVPPAKDYTPGKGVPVSDFQDGQMPAQWLYAGGLRPPGSGGALAGIRGMDIRLDAIASAPPPPEDDPLAALGGPQRARPEVGTAITFGGKTVTFQPLSHEKDKGYWQSSRRGGGNVMIDITNAAGRAYWSRNYFYTVIRNEQPRWVRVRTGHRPARVYLNGVCLDDDDCAHIERGLYAMLVCAPIDWMNPWGRHLMQPRLIQQTQQQAKDLVARRREECAARLRDWQFDLEQWQRSGGMHVEYLKLQEIGRLVMYLHYREAVGTGGFQAELTHYSNIATGYASRYAPAYRNVFGRDVSPYDDITHFLPRKMFVHVYGDGGKPVAQEINGSPSVGAELFACLLPVVPEKWKAAVLWGWRRHAGLGAGAAPERLLDAAPARTLLHYPLDVKPEHPSKAMPLTWRAPTLGFFAFRNAWRDGDDFIAQVFLKARRIGGWNAPNGGTFRLGGLGHVWAHGPTDRNRFRWEENLVMLPDNPEINEGACGHLTYLKTEDDGSGLVAIDMNDIYATRQPGRRRLYESYGGLRRPWAFKESGITGLRCIGVDYSGRSGAPCLLAVVDRIDGGGRRIWTWQLAPSGGKGRAASHLPDTSVDGRSFTIRKSDGATLRGTFIAPGGAKLTAEIRQKSMIGRAGSSAGKKLPRPIHAVFAEGGDHFFVVVTVQRGEPPEVKVEGGGLRATATIGKRTVRFDGRKIVFGSAE
jgi:hypothetical protein